VSVFRHLLWHAAAVSAVLLMIVSLHGCVEEISSEAPMRDGPGPVVPLDPGTGEMSEPAPIAPGTGEVTPPVSPPQRELAADSQPPTATIVFPGTTALLTSAQVTVRGTAHDQNLITQVMVQDISATSVDNFATWEATLQLSPGIHTLRVSTEDALGNHHPAAATAIIEIGTLLDNPRDVAVSATGAIFVTDVQRRAVIRIDPQEGHRTLISDAGTGQGPPFGFPAGIAVEATGQLLVTDMTALGVDGSMQGTNGIVRINPLSGDRAIVTDSIKGKGPTLSRFLGSIAVEATGQILVTDGFLSAVLRVDPVTGDRSILSDATVGQGPAFSNVLVGLAIESTGHILVAELQQKGPFGRTRGRNGIVRIDSVRGDRTVLSDTTTGTGVSFTGFLRSLAVDTVGQIYAVDAGLRTVVHVAPINGDRTLLAASPVLAGGIATEATGDLLVIATGSPDAVGIVRIDPRSGKHTLLSGPVTLGSGPRLQAPGSLIVETTGKSLVLDGDTVIRVDPHTGNRTVVSSPAAGTGPPLRFPQGIVHEAEDQLLVLETNGVVRIHTNTGHAPPSPRLAVASSEG